VQGPYATACFDAAELKRNFGIVPRQHQAGSTRSLVALRARFLSACSLRSAGLWAGTVRQIGETFVLNCLKLALNARRGPVCAISYEINAWQSMELLLARNDTYIIIPPSREPLLCGSVAATTRFCSPITMIIRE
jgi:hypothetical protein